MISKPHPELLPRFMRELMDSSDSFETYGYVLYIVAAILEGGFMDVRCGEPDEAPIDGIYMPTMEVIDSLPSAKLWRMWTVAKSFSDAELAAVLVTLKLTDGDKPS